MYFSVLSSKQDNNSTVQCRPSIQYNAVQLGVQQGSAYNACTTKPHAATACVKPTSGLTKLLAITSWTDRREQRDWSTMSDRGQLAAALSWPQVRSVSGSPIELSEPRHTITLFTAHNPFAPICCGFIVERAVQQTAQQSRNKLYCTKQRLHQDLIYK